MQHLVEFHPRFSLFPPISTPSAGIEAHAGADLTENFERSFIVSLSRRGYPLRHIFGPLTPLAMGWRSSARTTQSKVDLASSHTRVHLPLVHFFLPFTRAGLSLLRSVVDREASSCETTRFALNSHLPNSRRSLRRRLLKSAFASPDPRDPACFANYYDFTGRRLSRPFYFFTKLLFFTRRSV